VYWYTHQYFLLFFILTLDCAGTTTRRLDVGPDKKQGVERVGIYCMPTVIFPFLCTDYLTRNPTQDKEGIWGILLVDFSMVKWGGLGSPGPLILSHQHNTTRRVCSSSSIPFATGKWGEWSSSQAPSLNGKRKLVKLVHAMLCNGPHLHVSPCCFFLILPLSIAYNIPLIPQYVYIIANPTSL